MISVDTDLLLGGRYRLLSPIASGGMGVVWEADDTVLHRRVAVKVLSEALAEDHRFVERFRREARAAAGLSHPNVAGVFDYAEDPHARTPFIVMELIEGETLARRIARLGPLPPAEAARVARAVAEALQAAHDARIVHRDVKPANVMLMPSGRVKVLDFGIAAAATPSALTSAGMAMGTAAYIAPEQAAGLRATPATDVYSLGVVLYEMLAGQPPFVRDNPVALVAAHLHESPPPLPASVPPAVAEIAGRALAKNPADRPASAAALAAMLEPRRLAAPAGPGAKGVAGVMEPMTAATADAVPDGVGGTPTARLSSVQGRSSATVPLSTGQGGSAPTSRLPVDGPRPARPGRPGRSRAAVLATLASLGVLIAVFATLALGRGQPSGRPSPTHATMPRAVAVPVVRGAALATAEHLLAARGLHSIVRFAPGTPGVVLSSSPPGGQSVSPGSSVTLYVGAPAPPDHHGKHKKGKGHGG